MSEVFLRKFLKQYLCWKEPKEHVAIAALVDSQKARVAL